jgi:hypothetical protein
MTAMAFPVAPSLVAATVVAVVPIPVMERGQFFDGYRCPATISRPLGARLGRQQWLSTETTLALREFLSNDLAEFVQLDTNTPSHGLLLMMLQRLAA